MLKSSKKINILLISRDFLPRIGGVATYNKNLLSFFRNKKNIFFNVLTFQPQNFKKQQPYLTEEKNAKIIRFPLLKTIGDTDGIDGSCIITVYFKSLFYTIYLVVKSFFYLLKNRERIDIIYGTGARLVLSVLYVLKIFRKPIICHFHADSQFSNKGFLLRFLAFNLCKSCDYLFVNSLDCKADLLKIGIEEDKIILIHNWVDFNLFKPENKKLCRRKLNLPQNKFIFLFASRISVDKQVNLLLQTIKYINKKDDSFLFLFIGDGAEQHKVVMSANKYKNVIYLGERKNSELPEFINAADLTWGICDINYVAINVIESLACGVPVIAPNRVDPVFGDIKYKLRVKNSTLPENVGFLINPNPQLIAQKLLWISKNKAILNSMLLNCRNFAKDVYGYKNPEKIYKIFKNIFKNNSGTY